MLYSLASAWLILFPITWVVSDVYYSEFEDEYGPYAGVFIKGAIAVMETI